MSRRNLTISGFDDVIKDIKNIHERKLRRKELLTVLNKTGLPVKRMVKKRTPIYTGNKVRTHTTSYGGLAEMQLKLSAGTLKRSVQVFKGKKAKNPKVFVGHRVLKRPKNYRSWISNAKRWDKNGWYGIFQLYDRKGFKGKDYLSEAVRANKMWIGIDMKRKLENYLKKKNL